MAENLEFGLNRLLLLVSRLKKQGNLLEWQVLPQNQRAKIRADRKENMLNRENILNKQWKRGEKGTVHIHNFLQFYKFIHKEK